MRYCLRVIEVVNHWSDVDYLKGFFFPREKIPSCVNVRVCDERLSSCSGGFDTLFLG